MTRKEQREQKKNEKIKKKEREKLRKERALATKRRKQAELRREKKKKRAKSVIRGMMFALFVIAVMFIIVAYALFSSYRDSYYPKNIVVEDELSAFVRTMPSTQYMELKLVAEELADNGNGDMLYPLVGTRYDYEASLLTKLRTEQEYGTLYIAQGTGNIRNDIIAHTEDYYSFLGKVTPAYEEKVSEEGVVDNYYAQYSSGYLSTGNFFKTEGFHVVALEYRATDSMYLFIAYVTEQKEELQDAVPIIKHFANTALKGSQEVANVSDETGVDGLELDLEQDSEQQIQDINAYIQEKYPDAEMGQPIVSQNTIDMSVTAGEALDLMLTEE